MSTSPMTFRYKTIPAAFALAVGLTFSAAAARAEIANKVLPMPATDISEPAAGPQTATFAGGCFWGVQAVFQHVNGVTNAVSGYAGGASTDANYKAVSAKLTNHAETVRVTFDPAKVTYGKLLQIFFSVALDPTQVDRQGADIGHHYRSVLFISDPAQEKVARAYLAQLTVAHAFDAPIVTAIDTTSTFYPAEAYHQDYLQLHPTEAYIVQNDLPLVRNLSLLFPDVWRDPAITTTKLAAN